MSNSPSISRSDERASSDPMRQLLRVYDNALQALRRGDVCRAQRNVALLRAAHPVDSPSASGLDGLYRYCEQAMAAGDIIGAAHTLRQLRDAWAQADQVTRAPAQTRFQESASLGASAR